MINGKVRSESHLIDQEAILMLRRKLPREWVVRELSPDYGIDLDVELFEKEEEKIVTLGERLYIQVKGTTKANYKELVIDVDGKKMAKRCITFHLDTAILRLVGRVGDSLPILLTVVDISAEEAFFISLNDYANFVLNDDEKWRMQKTKTIYIPCDNKIELTKLLRWYAIRPKLNSFFAEAASLMIDVEYEAEPEGYIKLVKSFALKYRCSDVWNCEKLGFVFLDQVHELIEDIVNCRNCANTNIMFRSFSENDYVSSGHYESMPLAIAKQFYTSRRLIQELGNANCIFLSCIRQLFTITKYEAMISM